MDDHTIVELPLADIVPGNNDRQRFKPGPLLELAQSIAEFGLAQPITVRKQGDCYQIVAGERRWRAHGIYTEKVQSGEWPESTHCKPGYIWVIMRTLADEEASGIMLIENVQREDLDPMEEARAYQTRLDEHNWSATRIAKLVKKSVETVQGRLKLLKLSPELQVMISEGDLKTVYGEEISVLDFNRQTMVVAWLREQSYIPSRKHLARFVGQLLAEQAQDSLFDLNALFCATAVEAAQQEDRRVSDMLPLLAHLPPLPQTRGNAGLMVDAYIAQLLRSGYHDEATVLLDFWRKMMKCNRLQLSPWDSQVLPLLEDELHRE